MGSEGLVVIGVGLLLGFFMVKLFPKTKFGKKLLENKDPKNKVLNDPELLVQKLKEGEGFMDEGKDMNYSVGEEDGKKVVKLDIGEEKKVSPPKTPKKDTKKKAPKKEKKKAQKKVKKKTNSKK